MKKINLIIVLVFAMNCGLKSQEYPINLKKAYQYFMEAKDLADKDNSELWGVNIYGPMMFVDPQTKFVVTNHSDTLGILEQKEKVFIGYLKPEDGIANTAIKWAGETWMMIMWESLSDDHLKRKNLMMHELYHCIQEKIGLPIKADNNSHLDEMQARIWLKMEWNALEKAVFSKGQARIQSITDALIFRNYRHELFSGAKENEAILEMNEGIAEYTGFKLSLLKKKDQLNYFKTVTSSRKVVKSYVRSFAYVSGPLYGYLLDAKSQVWHRQLSPDSDLGDLLKRYYDIDLESVTQLNIESCASKYNFSKVLAFEQQREEKRLVRIEALMDKFINNPVLKFDLKKMTISFDPRSLQPLSNYGTVYNIIRVVDLWGVLDVNNDALMSSDWKVIKVSAMDLIEDQNIISGNGWTLKLNDGWRLEDDGFNKILVK